MRYNKILLINPPYSGARARAVFCAGLGYIAQTIESLGIDYAVLDMSVGYQFKHLKKLIENFRPELIGVSIITYKFKETYEIIKSIKKYFPQVHIVTGGPHVSLFREEIFTHCPQIDYAVVLEGEETISELCQGNPLDSIKGLIYQNDSGVVYNADRPFITDLDRVPFPRYKKFELDKFLNKEVNAMSIVSSRGCPFECTFCPVAAAIGRDFRIRSPENIIEELTYWYDKGYRRFNFVDDNFTLIKERVYKLCDLMIKNNLKDLKLSCDNGIRADRVDRDLLKFMREAGFYRITIGAEGGNNKVLRNLNKAEDIETVKKTIIDAAGLGYEVNLFFLVGSPGETRRDLEDSFRIALDLPIGVAFFYNLIPFPKSELYSWIEKNGRFLKDTIDYLDDYPVMDNDPVFETPEMPRIERKKALRRAFAIYRKTLRKSSEKRLAHLGFLGKFIAFVYASKFAQDVLLRDKLFSKILYGFSDLCFNLRRKNRL